MKKTLTEIKTALQEIFDQIPGEKAVRVKNGMQIRAFAAARKGEVTYYGETGPRTLSIVEYEDDGAKQYCGPNNGTDHFELKATDGDGHASLHRFPDSIILEGSWKEGGVRGMWKIKLEKN